MNAEHSCARWRGLVKHRDIPNNGALSVNVLSTITVATFHVMQEKSREGQTQVWAALCLMCRDRLGLIHK